MVDAVVDEVVATVINDAVIVDVIFHEVVDAIISETSCSHICQRISPVDLVD